MSQAASQTAAPAPPQPPRPLSETISPAMRAIVTITVMAATIMEVLDTSIVNVALPNMQGELGATLDDIGWVSTGYIISNVIVLPLTGWLSDVFGRRRYLAYSVILFTLASFGCGISRSLGTLVAFRIVQGLGGAAFLSTAQATLVEIYPKSRQGFAQAMFGMGVVMAPTLGPTVGGFITDHYTWPWIFFINVPVGILAGILCFAYVPDSQAASAPRRADFAGILLLAIGLGSLQTILERGEQEDWFEKPYITALALTALVGGISFIWWELSPRNKSPAVDLRVLANRNLAAGSAFASALGFGLYGSVLLIPQFLQRVQAHTAQQTGLLLLPGGIATAMMMPIIARLLTRFDPRFFIGIGMTILASSALWLAHLLTLETPNSAIFFPLILRGMGIGLQFVPLSIVALGTLKPNKVAEGAGLYNLFRQLGGSFGIAILATILDRRQKFHFDRLREHIDVGNVLVQQQLVAIKLRLAGAGYMPGDIDKAAQRILGGSVTHQAFNLSFIDAFWAMGWICLSALLLLFLFQRAKNRNTAAAAH
jgi:DHA2 family multidrug resistance protein